MIPAPRAVPDSVGYDFLADDIDFFAIMLFALEVSFLIAEQHQFITFSFFAAIHVDFLVHGMNHLVMACASHTNLQQFAIDIEFNIIFGSQQVNAMGVRTAGNGVLQALNCRTL